MGVTQAYDDADTASSWKGASVDDESRWVMGCGVWECPKCGYGIAPVEQIALLIDGHNRYEICTRNNIEFKTVPMYFDERYEAENWIDNNQSGRRNCNPEQMRLIRGRVYNRTKKAKHDGGQGKPRSGDQNEPNLKTADKLAEQFNVSPSTIKRDGQLAEAVEALGITDDYTNGRIATSPPEIVEAARPVIEARKEERRSNVDTVLNPDAELKWMI